MKYRRVKVHETKIIPAIIMAGLTAINLAVCGEGGNAGSSAGESSSVSISSSASKSADSSEANFQGLTRAEVTNGKGGMTVALAKSC